MLDANDPLTQQMCNRLKTTSIGLGLVRLLMDAGRTEEGRTTLAALQDGCHGVEQATAKLNTSRSKRPGEPPSFTVQECVSVMVGFHAEMSPSVA
jgi:predicted N-formylglutamate amidohydrolase